MNKNLYRKITDALVKDGYIIINDALDAKLCASLLEVAKGVQNYKKAGISNTNNLHIDNNKRRDRIAWLDETEKHQKQFLSITEELKNHLNKALYLGLSYYESHFAIYDKGDFYETHLDAFKNSKNRVVTTVYYLNETWADNDAGELVIYNEKNELLHKVSPQGNTLVVFLSDKFPHQVLATNKIRYSIAGWFRVDRRL